MYPQETSLKDGMINPKSRRAAHAILTNMANDKEIRHQHTKYIEMDHLWMAPGVRPIELGNFDHNLTVGWIYVAINEFGDSFTVEEEVSPELMADLTADINGTTVRFEIDMGNMDKGRIIEKMDKYIRSTRYPDKCIWILKDGKYQASAIGQALLGYADSKKLGNMFTVARFERFVNELTVFSPVSKSMIQLTDLVK